MKQISDVGVYLKIKAYFINAAERSPAAIRAVHRNTYFLYITTDELLALYNIHFRYYLIHQTMLHICRGKSVNER